MLPNSGLCPSDFWGAERILNGFRPSDGIQSIMAKKQNPEILGCAPLRGGTHSILAYSLPVLSRKIVEYVSSLFFLLFSSPSGVFLSWRAEPILSWQKGGTKKILNSYEFLSPLPSAVKRKAENFIPATVIDSNANGPGELLAQTGSLINKICTKKSLLKRGRRQITLISSSVNPRPALCLRLYL